MDKDLLWEVQQTELKAESIKKKANEEAKLTVSDAKKYAFEIYDRGIEEAEKEAEKIRKKASDEASDIIREKKIQFESELTKTILNARDNKEKAIDIICERIVNS